MSHFAMSPIVIVIMLLSVVLTVDLLTAPRHRRNSIAGKPTP
jgi:hypothetical protein